MKDLNWVIEHEDEILNGKYGKEIQQSVAGIKNQTTDFLEFIKHILSILKDKWEYPISEWKEVKERIFANEIAREAYLLTFKEHEPSVEFLAKRIIPKLRRLDLPDDIKRDLVNFWQMMTKGNVKG